MSLTFEMAVYGVVAKQAEAASKKSSGKCPLRPNSELRLPPEAPVAKKMGLIRAPFTQSTDAV
jgi:hypothetical protein